MCTLGPSSQDVDVLTAMLEAGMTAARIDLTWGSYEFHHKSLSSLQEAMKRSRRLCAIVLDTLGREIMVLRQPDK
jgi:pyruvate kinase